MIRDMTLDDIDEVYAIENEAFFEPKSKEGMIKDLSDNKLLSHFVYEVNGEILGFFILNFVMDELEIYTIAVKKEERKRKIGSFLIEEIIKKAKEENIKKIFLEVSTNNSAGLALYNKFGFEVIGTRENYYSLTGENAYSMCKEII